MPNALTDRLKDYASQVRTLTQDPTAFFRAITGESPYEWQQWLLAKDLHRAKVCLLISRRSGKTLTTAARLLLECLTTTRKAFRCICFAPSLEQGSLVFNAIRSQMDCKPIARFLMCYEKVSGKKLLNSARKLEIPNIHGGVSTVSILAADLSGGSAIRQVGFDCDVLCVDEAALISTATFNRLKPAIKASEYKCLMLLSTPRGCDGFFFDYCKPPDNEEQPTNCHYRSALGADVYHSDVYQAKHLLQTQEDYDELEQDKLRMLDEEYCQEYLALFQNWSGHFFRREDIQQCVAPVAHWAEYTQNPLVASIDIGIEHDPSVLTVGAYNSKANHLTVCFSEAYMRSPKDGNIRGIQSKSDIVARLVALRDGGLRPVKVYADITNDESFESLLVEHGFNCIPIHWSGIRTKTDMMFRLRDAIASAQLTLPADTYHGRQYAQQLASYNYDVSEEGNYRFNRRGKNDNKKRFCDDYVCSLAMLTLHLADKRSAKPVIRLGKALKWVS